MKIKQYILLNSLISAYLLFAPFFSFGQISLTGSERRVFDNANYNYTLIPKASIKRLNDAWFLTPDKYQESASFTDPMGRAIVETVFDVQGELDLVNYTHLDANGRPTTGYLPFVTTSDKGYVSNPVADQANFYNNSNAHNIETDAKAYSTTEFEASPLGRILSQTGPGDAWQNNGKKTSFSYRVNTTNEVYRIEPDEYEGSFVVTGYYPGGSLTVTEVTNPDGVKLKQYYDGYGRLILSDQAGNKTYNIYDEFGRIVFVLPPLASERLNSNSSVQYLSSSVNPLTKDPLVNTYVAVDGASVTLKPPFSFNATNGSSLTVTATSRLYFEYIYDEYGRIIKKYQPSREAEEYIYDQVNRPIMYRDGNLRKEGKWKYIKYDTFGRLAYWGVIASSATRETLQAEADNAQFLFENYSSGNSTHEIINAQQPLEYSTSGNYTLNRSYPTVDLNSVMEEYVYDTHFELSPVPPTGEGINYTKGSAKGLLTRLRSRVLDSNNWIVSNFYYNPEGRLVLTQRINELSRTIQRTYAEYDFSGQISRMVFVHCDNNVPKLTLNYYYTYTKQGQPKEIDLEIPGSVNRYQIAAYEYNVMGELVKRNLGKNSDATYLQQVDYYYNLRGWLTRINNVDDATSNDLFSQKLHYADGLSAVNGTARYDGSISASQWRIKGVNPQKMAYGYQYDNHNRLTNAKYASGSNLNENVDGYSESFTYDSNGNIASLQRKGKRTDNSTDLIDNLTYSYSGNQLTAVSDAVAVDVENTGFKNSNVTGVDYTYDSNGNMTKDLNKGITQITYNILNLPQTVGIASPATQYTFTYAASGEKLRVVEVQGTSTTTLTYDGPLTFEGALLKSIATPEGRINSNGYTGYIQEYMIADNQGNVRVTFDKYNGAARVLNERHFYPSGLSYLNRNSSAVNNFGYGGKEEYDSPLSWLDFHARMYDPTIARWHTPDPLAEKFAIISPYNYCMGNPVNYIDPDGREAITFEGEAAQEFWRQWISGRWSSVESLMNEASFSVSIDGGGGGGGFMGGIYYGSEYSFVAVEAFGRINLIAYIGDSPGLSYAPCGAIISSNPTATFVTSYVPQFTEGGIPNWVGTTIGATNASAGYFQTAYIVQAGQTLKYGQRVNGVVRSAKTLTRANRISSLSAARTFSKAGTGLTILSAGVTVVDGLTNKNGWQNHHTADLIVTGTIYATAAAFPVVGWIAGGLYFAADLTTQYYTGKSITQNLFDQ